VSIRARSSLLPLLAGTGLVLTIDLGTKHAAVRDPSIFGQLVYNPVMPLTSTRLVVCITTVLVISLIGRLAARRGIGAIPVVWFAGGMLVGGTLANWVSKFIWGSVPDFIPHGDRLWNLADFSIGSGMLLFTIATVTYWVRGYVRMRGDLPRA
jgi:hypothetical protein